MRRAERGRRHVSVILEARLRSALDKYVTPSKGTPPFWPNWISLRCRGPDSQPGQEVLRGKGAFGADQAQSSENESACRIYIRGACK